VIAEAEGETSRFLSILAEYRKAPEVTRKRLYLDTLESVLHKSSKVVVDTKSGGNNLLYLPLDKLMKRGSEAASDSVPSKNYEAKRPGDSSSSSSSSGTQPNSRVRDASRSREVR
jgi:membrane protease subunit HflK